MIWILSLNTSDDVLWLHKADFDVEFPKPRDVNGLMIFDTNRTTMLTSYIEIITKQVSSNDRPK